MKLLCCLFLVLNLVLGQNANYGKELKILKNLKETKTSLTLEVGKYQKLSLMESLK